MKVGVTFPQSDLELDRDATRRWATAAEEAGFDHLLFYDHVLGADTSVRPDWTGFHGSEDRFHEVMVLLGFLSAVTERMKLITGIVCLPQRQTALFAKQAAEVDHLSNGRLRLGVGVGWNPVEFEALGMDFTNRGARMEEQIELLRLLWTQQHVDFDGQWHRITAAGLNPRPLQQPIPIWIGSMLTRTIDRVARLADGWMPEYRDPDVLAPQLEVLHERLEAHGRDRSTFGLHGRLSLKDGDPGRWREVRDFWREAGATDFSVSTIWSGEDTLDGHVRLMHRFIEEVGL